MNTYPKGNDLKVKWSLVYSDDSAFPLGDYEYELSYCNNRGLNVVSDTSVITVEDNILTWDFKGYEQFVSGVYSLTLKIFLSGSKVVQLNYDNAFNLSSLKMSGTSANIVSLTSVCDMIDIQDAALQARKALDYALVAVREDSLDNLLELIENITGVTITKTYNSVSHVYSFEYEEEEESQPES